MITMDWSYSTLVYLKLDPAVSFQEDGYRGDFEQLIKTSTDGNHFGVLTLQ